MVAATPVRKVVAPPVVPNPLPDPLPALLPGMLDVRALAQSGAAHLAVLTLSQHQGDVSHDREHWIAWEKERISILRHSEMWRAIAQRLARLPAGLPLAVTRWAETQRAVALIRLGEGSQALALLRQLIWSLPPTEVAAGQWLFQWRRLVLDAYLAMGAVDDAHQAAAHYFRDYGAVGSSARLLRARILLSAGWSDEAMALLRTDADLPSASAMLLLAELRSHKRRARRVLNIALRRLRGKPDAKLDTLLWAVVAEAALQIKDYPTAANGLEHVLASPVSLPDGLFSFSADDLWKAYFTYARSAGNRSQYLIGDDGPWFAEVKNSQKKKPVRARSLLALLIFHGASTLERDKAAAQFVASMRQRKNSGRLLSALFLHSAHYPNQASVPLVARYVLVDVALAQADLVLASSLMKSIKIPPQGADRFFWQLRRARILVLGGEYKQGAAALQHILNNSQRLSAGQIDQFLQVVFDLQTVQAHADALQLLRALMPFSHELKQRRELYYWMADSQTAMQRHAEAARLYLKSAMLPGIETMDPWAQTARYHAAEALAQAGMVHDARRLFEQLLKVTRDPARRSALRRELQKLWLVKEQAPLAVPGESVAPRTAEKSAMK